MLSQRAQWLVSDCSMANSLYHHQSSDPGPYPSHQGMSPNVTTAESGTDGSHGGFFRQMPVSYGATASATTNRPLANGVLPQAPGLNNPQGPERRQASGMSGAFGGFALETGLGGQPVVGTYETGLGTATLARETGPDATSGQDMFRVRLGLCNPGGHHST